MSEDAKTVMMQLMCGVFVKLDNIHQIAAKHGHAAHEAGNTSLQHALEDVHSQLTTAQVAVARAIERLGQPNEGEGK